MTTTQLASAIRLKEINIGVIGLGYVGLPLAMLFARKGFSVTGFIRDHKKIKAIREGTWQGDSVDPKELGFLVRKGALHVSHIDSSDVEKQDVFFVCVPTPVFQDKKPDLTAVREVARRLKSLRLSGKLIINESTVAPGTTREVFGHFEGSYYLACSPERVDPGNIDKTVETVAKVIGAVDSSSLRLTTALYNMVLSAPTVSVSSLEAAETTKMLENTYRAVNIALVNEFALLAEKSNLDVLEIIEAAKTKWSFHAHYPSIGVGGHCIPVDPWYLVEYGRSVHLDLPLITLGLEENERMTRHVAEKLHSLYKKGMSVLLYGLTYKRNVRDLRESPVIEFASMVQKQGIPFKAYDPLFSTKEVARLGLKPGSLAKADIFIVGTDHAQLQKEYTKAVGPHTIVLDGRNFFRKKVGKIVYGIGRTLV